MDQMDTGVSADDGVAEERVVDVDGVEIDALTIDWMVFIALHMEADRQFPATELLVDLLLMLGYRDDEEVAALADTSLYRTALRSALGRLGDQGARLVRDVIVEGDEALHYELTQKRVQDIREVADAIGGTVWGEAGTDEIDTYSEVAWLAIMALRLEDGHFVWGVPTGGRHKLTRDEILGVLNSVWRHGDEDQTLLELNRTLGDLRDKDYVKLERERPFVGPEVWVLEDKAWGGVYSLRDQLKRDIEGAIPPVTDRHQDPQVASREGDVSATDSWTQAEGASLVRESERHQPSLKDPGSDREIIVSDLDLCVATLLALPRDLDRENHPPRERDIIGEVANRLDIPGSWLDENSAGPWVANGAWARMVKRRKRVAHLLAYRIEHVFRALSVEQAGLIRDVAVNEGDVGRWALTEKGLAVVQLGLLEGENAGQVLGKRYDAIPEYFGMHATAWRAEDAGWVRAVVERFRGMTTVAPEPGGRKMEGREVRGRAFELLIADLIEDLDGVSSVEIQDSNEYLDKAGVDLVEKSEGQLMGGRPTAMLIQCKYNPLADVQSDAASKLFATTVWLRTLSQRKELAYEVAGARLVFIGDLSREATWTFWALKAVVEPMSAAGREADINNDDVESDGTPKNLVWEVWDSWKVFQLMKEHKIGVRVDQGSDGELVELDEGYFEKLESRVRQRASAVATRDKGVAE